MGEVRARTGTELLIIDKGAQNHRLLHVRALL